MTADGELVMRKMVNALAQSSAELLKQSENVENFKRIVPSLLDKGLDNINLNMFSEEMRVGLLNAMGDEYARKGKLPEAIKAFILAGNKAKLVTIGLDYERVGLFSSAIDAYRLADATDKLLKLGNKCLEDGRIAEKCSFYTKGRYPSDGTFILRHVIKHGDLS